MTRHDTAATAATDGEGFGRFAFHSALPDAIRTLENDELRALLVALLLEWRYRAEVRER